MFWIVLLALVMSAALIKFGMLSVLVGLLSTALTVALACIGGLVAFLLWQSWRKRR
jgi:hypothetical protein